VVLIVGAILTPAYLRAIDRGVLETAGGEPELVSEAFSLLSLEKPGVAELLYRAAVVSQLADLPKVETALGNARGEQVAAFQQGDTDPLIQNWIQLHRLQGTNVVSWFVSSGFRGSVVEHLEQSNRPGVRELMHNRSLQALALFFPVSSAGGQAFDSAILMTGLLYQEDHLNASFRKELETLAAEANRGLDTRPLESVYLDLMSLSKRLNWGQLTAFIQKVDSAATLRTLVHHASRSDEMLATVFSGVWFAESGSQLATYLRRFAESGSKDLQTAVGFGQGSVRYLMARQEPVYVSSMRESLRSLGLFQPVAHALTGMTFRLPMIGLLTKYLLFLFGSFFVFRLIYMLKPGPDKVEASLQVEGIGILRQQIMALVALIFLIAFGEPFLAQDSKKMENPINWRFPVVESAVTEKIDKIMDTKITQITILALVVFFLVQVSIYALCLVKLKEIKKQEAKSRLKLRLLDNEDNMFDAGLYVGLGGTVLSLVMLALGMVNPGLMSAYASTLFGIIFVSVLKIFHVRPYRRKLIVENEMESA
jgi:hypothetical protein